jgi:hypothetical protein
MAADEQQTDEQQDERQSVIELEDIRARFQKVREAVLTVEERKALCDPDVTPDNSPKASEEDQADREPAAVDIPRDRAANPPADAEDDDPSFTDYPVDEQVVDPDNADPCEDKS